MSGDAEAVGAAIGAGLVARALDGDEARAGERHGVCPNCGSAVGEKYCGVCGQPAHLHRSLLHLVEEALHGIIHFDNRFWRTLPMLAFRPGTLTHNYIHGKRARYISPLAAFLLSVFLMFLALSAFNQISIDGANFSGETTAGASQAEAAADERPWQDQLRDAVRAGEITIGFGDEKFQAKVLKKLENPDLLLYKLQQTSYKFSWLLIPISIPFVWLLLAWRRGHTSFDHGVFVLYSIAFMSLLWVVIAVISPQAMLAVAVVPWLMFAAPPAHMFFQLKGGYGLSWFSAAWRTLVLVTFALVSLALFVAAVIGLGLL